MENDWLASQQQVVGENIEGEVMASWRQQQVDMSDGCDPANGNLIDEDMKTFGNTLTEKNWNLQPWVWQMERQPYGAMPWKLKTIAAQ